MDKCAVGGLRDWEDRCPLQEGWGQVGNWSVSRLRLEGGVSRTGVIMATTLEAEAPDMK